MKSIKKMSLHEMIAVEIKKYIKDKKLKKGDKLPSAAELTEILGVSRSTLREGLRFLEGIEVIEVLNGKGIFVKEGDFLKIEAKIEIENEKNLLLHISELRRALEGKAVELAAIRASDQQITEMETHLINALKLKELNQDSSKEDLAFHRAIYQASNNPLLESAVESVSDAFNKFWSRPFGIEKIFDDSFPYHQTLLEGIKQRNPERALLEFNKLMDCVENTVKKVVLEGSDVISGNR